VYILGIRVLIADDHAVVREGLERMMKANAIEVVAQANDVNSACTMYANHKPDVLVMDISMPGSTGIDGVQAIRKRNPNAKIVIFSIYENTQLVERVLDAGAMAYVAKSSALMEIVSAINMVYKNKTYISSELAQSMVYSRLEPTKNPLSTLSEREFNIFCLIAEGKDISEVAKKIFLAEKTVANYIGLIKQKLKLKNSADIVRLAIQNDLIQIDRVT